MTNYHGGCVAVSYELPELPDFFACVLVVLKIAPVEVIVHCPMFAVKYPVLGYFLDR